MRRVPLLIAAFVSLSRGASAQPVPPAGTAVITSAGAAALEPPVPGTPVPAATAAIETAPALAGHIPAPGEEYHLQPGAFSGDPGTALGDAGIFAALSPMQKAWFLRGFHRARGDAEAEKDALAKLVELRVDSGLWNATSYAAALVHESRAFAKAGKGEDAVTAAKAATDLAPDFPAAHTALARASLAAGDYAAAPAALEAAIGAALRNLRVRLRVLGNLAIALLAGAWLAYAIFLVLTFFRHGRFLAHDFRHAFADKMPGWLASVILVPFLAFPLVFGLGVLPLLAWITLVLWLQMTTRERAVAAAFLVLGGATPWLARQAGVALAFEGGEESRLYHAIREDEVDSHTLAELTASAEAEKDRETLLTIANVHAHAGRYAEAEAFYKRAADAGAGAAADVGAGFVRYGLGDVAGAIAAFDRAVGADSQEVAAHFNLSQIYAERTELEKSQANLLAAKAVDAKRCDRLLTAPLPPARRAVAGMPGIIAPAYANHFLLLDEISDERLLARVTEGGAADAVVRQSWKQVSPALSLPSIGSIFIATLLIAGALTGLFRGVIPARPCHHCGTCLCLRCDGPPLQDDVCVQCYHTYLDTAGTDPRIRAEKEHQVGRHHDRLRAGRRILSFLIPGGGLLFGGNTVRGAVTLLLASVLAMRVIFWDGVIRPVFPDGGAGPLVAGAITTAALVAVWITGMRGAGAEPEKGT